MTDYSKMTDAELDLELAKLEAGAGSPPAGSPPMGTLAAPTLVPPLVAAPDPYAGMSDADLDAELAKVENPQVIQEMHPAFTQADRLVVKNFTNNNEASVNYLQKRHPNLEIKVDDKSGQIQGRSRDGSDGGAFRVLDPDLGFFGNINPVGNLEFYKDLGDIGYDAAAGLASGVATAAGGLAGAAAGAPAGGVGAVPGAMLGAGAAGAASSGALELLRQKLGNALGVEQDTDWTQAGVATGAGAVSPLLFGTGGVVGGALGRKVLGEGLETGAKETLQKAQRGLIGVGVDKYVKPALTKIGSEMSGATQGAIRGLAKNMGLVKKIEKDPMGRTNFIKEKVQHVGGILRQAKKAAWDGFQESVGMVPRDTAVDVRPARAAFEEAIAEAVDADDMVLAESLRKKFNELGFATTDVSSGTVVPKFKQKTVTTPGGETIITDPDASGMVPILGDSGEPLRDPATGAIRMEHASRDARVSSVFGDASSTTEAALDGVETLGAGEVSHTVHDQLPVKKAMQLERRLGAEAELSRMGPTDIKGGVGNRFKQGDTFEDKVIMQTAADAKQRLAAALGETLPPDTLAKRAQYGEIANMEKAVRPLTKTPDKALNTFRNLGNQARHGQQEMFANIDKTFGTDLINSAEVVQAVDTFADAGFLPLSKGGISGRARAVPLAAVGGGLGYWAGSSQGGDGRGSGVLGGLAGGALGAILGGPAAMRKYIQFGLHAGKANQGLGPLRTAAGQDAIENQFNPWMGVKP